MMRLQYAIHITIVIASIVIMAAFSPLSQAKDFSNTLKYFNKNGATVGITKKLTGPNLTIIIDQKKLLQTIPKLQKAGYVDPRLSKTEMDFSQTLLTAAVSIPYVVNIIRNIYLNSPNIDQVHVSAYLRSMDLYGNNSKSFCYSFNFNRQLYQKINWKNFQPNNIKQIAPDFKTSDLCDNLEETNPRDI